MEAAQVRGNDVCEMAWGGAGSYDHHGDPCPPEWCSDKATEVCKACKGAFCMEHMDLEQGCCYPCGDYEEEEDEDHADDVVDADDD